MSLIMDALNKARQERQAAALQEEAKALPPAADVGPVEAFSVSESPAKAEEGTLGSVFVGETEFLEMIRGAGAKVSSYREPVPAAESRLLSRKFLTHLTLICTLTAAIVLSVTTLSRFWVIESEILKKALPHTAPGTANSQTFAAKPLPAAFSIQGILWDAQDPIVLIGNKTFRTGDLWAGHQLLSIQPDGITVQDAAGMRHEIKVQT